jgi:hypothetical protein
MLRHAKNPETTQLFEPQTTCDTFIKRWNRSPVKRERLTAAKRVIHWIGQNSQTHSSRLP